MINPRRRFIAIWAKEFGKVDLRRVLEAIIQLDHRILLDVVVETLQLNMKYWRERLEHDSLLGFLRAKFASGVVVNPVNGYIISE